MSVFCRGRGLKFGTMQEWFYKSTHKEALNRRGARRAPSGIPQIIRPRPKHPCRSASGMSRQSTRQWDARVSRSSSGRAGAALMDGVDPTSKEVAQEVAGNLTAVAEVGRDLWCRPYGVGECDHLDAVAGLRRQSLAPQGLEFVTGGVVKVNAYHTELWGNLVKVPSLERIRRTTRVYRPVAIASMRRRASQVGPLTGDRTGRLDGHGAWCTS